MIDNGRETLHLVVHAGISLYQSRHSVSSLEDWFLQATGDMKNGETK